MQQAVWGVAVLTSSACNGAAGLANCARTRAYRDRRAREQLPPKDILRLKHYIARDVYKALIRQNVNNPDLPMSA
jgi:hypothetical protein